MMTKEEEIESLCETVRFLNDRVRAKDAALAEARELINDLKKWLAAHPAPKEVK